MPSAPGQKIASKSPPTTSSALVQARQQFARHDYNAAEESVWKVLNADPQNADALTLLGTIRIQQKRASEAESLFQRVVQLNPKSFSGRLELGRILVAEGKVPEAIEQFRQAQELEPANVEARVTLARLYAVAGEFASALSNLEPLGESRLPREAISVKVAALLALGRSDQAIALANRVTNPPLALALAENFVAAKMPDHALKLLARAQASGKKPPARFYFVKAKALDMAGNPPAANENYQRAIALEPKSEEFLLAAAELNSRQNKHDAAFGLLKKALELDPDSLTVIRPLILEASFAGKSVEVQDAAEKLQSISDQPQDLFVAASVFLKNSRQDEAVPLLEKYLQKMPNDARAWVGLGIGYEDMKRLPDAQKAFEHALEADPQMADAEYQMGQLMSLNSNSSAAMQHYERALQFNPNHALALAKLGKLYLESGNSEKARDALLRAESLNPSDREIEYGLALAYSKMGDREQARIHMDKFQKGSNAAVEKR